MRGSNKEKQVAISKRNEMRAAIDFGSGALKIQMNLVDVAQSRILGEPLIAKFTPLYLTEEVAAHAGRISETMADRALSLLRGYKREAESVAANLGFDSVRFVAVATEVFRKAHNGPDVLAHFERELGIQFRILSQHDEGVLGFATAKALCSDMPEALLLVWDSGNGSFQVSAKQAGKYNLFLGPLGHGTVRVLLSKDMRGGPVLRSHEFGNPISKEESVELSQKITRLLPAIPEWLTDKIKSEKTKVATYGDGESIFALVAQAISVFDGDKAHVNQKSMSLSEVERVMDELIGKENKAFDDAGLQGKTLTSAIHLHTVMKHFGIDKIEYRRSIGNAPGMLTSGLE